MKIKLLLISAFFLINTAYAQNVKLKGHVVDTELKKIAGATLILTNKADNSVLASTVSDTEGYFSLTTNKNISSELNVIHVSYRQEAMAIPAQCDSTLVICLEPTNYMLGDVTVTGKGKPIRFNDNGSMTVTLKNLAGYETQNTSEILKKMPGVYINASGDVMLNGQPVTVLMDGRDLKMDVAKFLQSLPAVALGEVELVANPMGMYDASMKAVINLVSRRNVENGHTAYFSVGSKVDRDANVGGNGNAFYMLKHKNIYFNNSLSYENSVYGEKNDGNAVYQGSGNTSSSLGTILSRDSRIMNNANLTAEMKHKQSIDVNLYLFYGNERTSNESLSAFSGEPTRSYNSLTKPETFFLSGNVKYQTGDNVPFKLWASYGFIYGSDKMKREMDVTETETEQPFLQYTQKNKSMGTQHVGKIYYNQNFVDGKLMLYAGLQDNLSLLSSDDNYNILFGDSPLSNTLFKGNENVMAVYTALQYRPTPELTFYIAGRAEHTYYEIKTNTAGDVSTNNYWNILPYAYIYYQPSKIYSGTLMLSSNLSRPSYDYMMPGVYYYNEHSYEVGNPYLIPQYEYRLSLQNTLFEFAYINLNGVYGKNNIDRILNQKENDVTEYTYSNCVDNMGFSADIGIPFQLCKDKLTGQLSASGSVGKYINPKNGFNLLPDRKQYYSAYASLYVNYQIIPRLSVNGYANYIVRAKGLQRTSNGYAYLNLGAEYAFLKDKSLVVSVSANDIFNSRKSRSVSFYDDVINNVYSKRTSQNFSLTISYRFGKGLKIDREVSEDPNDTDRFF